MSGSRIPDLGIRIAGTCLAGGLFLGIALEASAAAKPTPTPTAAPRKLSGGFGRGAADAIVTPAAAVTPGAVEPSLADAVRAGRKKREPRKAVSITNETLVRDPKKGRLSTASPRSETPPAAAADEVKPAPPAATGEAEAEAYWRERMHGARARVEELRERIRQLEQEAKKLENDFYSWDDGQYRDGVIKPAWDKKREELETAKKELEQAEKDLAELPEKARKAGALPGWLRE